MKLIALLFLAFLALSNANQATLKGLAKINSDPTGAAILSAISLNLKAKTPLSEIGDLLQSILNAHLAESQDFEAKTTNNIDRLNAAIADGQALSTSYQNTISTLSSTIETAQNTVADDQEQLGQYQEALAAEEQAISDRDAAAATDLPELDADIVDFGNAISACNDAISKMTTYKESNEKATSFIQIGTSVRDKLKKVTDTVYGMKKKLSKHSNMFTPLTRELIDLSATLNQSKADQVISLLGQLLAALSDAKTRTESARATYATNYENDQEASKTKVADYQARIEQLNQEIAGLTDKIQQSSLFLQQNQDNLADNLANIQSNQDQLESVQADYATRKQKYDNLIELIRQAINYFNQNLSEVDSYVSSTVNGSL